MESLHGIDSFLLHSPGKSVNKHDQKKKLEFMIKTDQNIFKNLIDIAQRKFDIFPNDSLVLFILELVCFISC